MVGRLNRSCAKNGVIAYQDSESPETFHYFPARIDAVGSGKILTSYDVRYYGINAKPYFIDLGNGDYQSVVGAVASGQAVADITKKQQDDITAEAKRIYKVRNVNLVPLMLENVTVQPILAQNIVNMGSGGSMTFPERLQIGTQFGFNVSSGNSLFAELVGLQGSDDVSHSPQIGVNFYGQCELQADPWIAEVSADLTQVWEYTRSQFAAEARIGWLNIGNASFDSITQNLIKRGIVKIRYIQGQGGKEFGWQLLQTTKDLFEEINRLVASGDGLFKFEPNPTPQEPASSQSALGADLLPYSVSINMSYVSNIFKQSVIYSSRIEFQGLIPVDFNGNMALALVCNTSTQRYFYDLQIKSNGCITKDKSDGLQNRIRREAEAKNNKLKEYANNLGEGRWTFEQYIQMVALLNTMTLTETKKSVDPEDMEVLSEAEALEALGRLESRVAMSWSRTEEERGVGQHAVFPPDNRKRVANTKTAPWNGVGLLRMKFPNGETYVGTAILVDSAHIATAAHNLYDSGLGGRATEVVFRPGNDATIQPFGEFKGLKWYFPREFETNENEASLDYAIVRLSKAAPADLTKYALKVAADKDLKTTDFQIAGYPGDKTPSNTMWTGSGRLTEVTGALLKYTISTGTGQSGSAVAAKDAGGAWCSFGIHHGSNGVANIACRITQTVKQNMENWIDGRTSEDFDTVVIEHDPAKELV